MNIPDSIDVNWHEASDITIHDAAFWMQIGSDPKIHAEQFKVDYKYSLNYSDHPEGEHAVNQKYEVIFSAIRAGDIKVTKEFLVNSLFDVNETYISKLDWINFCQKKQYKKLCELFLNPSSSKNLASSPASNDDLASFFDPVTVAALEKMFPAQDRWKKWSERAKRNGLNKARRGRAMFNPYFAAQWFLQQNIVNYDVAKCNRILAKNLPARSKGKEDLFSVEVLT